MTLQEEISAKLRSGRGGYVPIKREDVPMLGSIDFVLWLDPGGLFTGGLPPIAQEFTLRILDLDSRPDSFELVVSVPASPDELAEAVRVRQEMVLAANRPAHITARDEVIALVEHRERVDRYADKPYDDSGYSPEVARLLDDRQSRPRGRHD